MSSVAPPGTDPPAERTGGLHEHLVTGIRQLIVRGALPGGTRVPEVQLCARLGVSRTPLREALKALSVEGLVTLQPNRGATVAPLDPAELATVFEAKGALEHFIGLNAAVRASDAGIAGLVSLHADLIAAETAEDRDAYTELNEAFHLGLARLAGNSEVVTVYERLQARVLRARYRVNEDPARVRASLAEHEGIVAALVARARLDLAERLVAHNAKTGTAVVQRLASAEHAEQRIA